jgi:hypothetical protein
MLDSLLSPGGLLAPVFVVHLAATLGHDGTHLVRAGGALPPVRARRAGRGFRAYAAEHGRRTTWVVAAPMLAELGTGLLLAWRRPPWVPVGTAWAGLALLLWCGPAPGCSRCPATAS